MIANKKQNTISLCLERFKELVYHGGPGFAQFAITSYCNARCNFCNFAIGRLASSERVCVPLDRALNSLDILRSNGVRYIVFVGGEPLLHKDIRVMVRHARENDMEPMICTNGAPLNPALIDGLKEDGLKSILISIDAATPELHEKNRGLAGVCATIKKANLHLEKLGIPSTASVTVSRLIPSYGELLKFLRSLYFKSVTFSYPLKDLGSTYLSYSDSELVDFTREELLEIFQEIKHLKSKFCIANPSHSISDMQRFLRKEKALFPCLAGYKYFFLDWNFNLYRCHFLKKPMCTIEEFEPSKLIRDGCTRCMIDCYRDPSVLQHIGVAISDSFNLLRKGHPIDSLKELLTYRTFASLQAVVENLRWIRNF